MSESHVLVNRERPAVTILTLNRPQIRNALNVSLLESLGQALASVEADQSQRVLILRGEGPAFCAGLDLKEARQDEFAQRTPRLVAQTLQAIYQSRLVTIAAVHGAAVAGGAGLMSACDLVVAADDARIGYPEVHRGLVAGLVMSFLYRQVGERRARELVLLGQFIDASRALEMGLVNRIVPAGQVDDESLVLAAGLLQGGPLAVERTNEIIAQLGPRAIDEDLELALHHHLLARQGPEATEGLTAFAQKRAPQWSQPERDRDRS